jgi:hypothetical protein
MAGHLKVFKVSNVHYSLTGECVICHKPQEVVVTSEALYKWQHGAFAQDAFPTLTVNQREFLISSICGKCFDKLFDDKPNVH